MVATVKEFSELMWDRFVNQTKAYTYMWAKDDKKGYAKPSVPNCGNTPICPNCNKYGKCTTTEDLPLYLTDIEQHVRGTKTIAPYQMSNENTVKYLELDIDSKGGLELAQKQVLALAKVIGQLLGPRSCLVELSGLKGYHIWILFGEQIAARFAYALGHYIKDQAGDIDEVEVEVFPKQITNSSYGSTTRLPFGIHRSTNVRGVAVDRNFEPHADQYAALHDTRLISEGELMEVIRVHNIQVPDSIRRDKGKGYTAYVCISRLMHEGAQEGNRDEIMYRLACYLRERGFEEEMTLLVVEEVNSKSPQPLDQRTIYSKVESAYKADFSGMPCFREAFDQFCSSSCPLFEKKVQWRKTTYEDLKRRVRD